MLIVKKYKSLVTNILNSVPGVYTIEFESLSGKYKYLPGQFLHLGLDTDYDGTSQWPESRCFSMQSNPNEAAIRLTYAVKGHFTRMMEQQLKVGSEVWLKLPYGDLFMRPHNKVNTVFIAGGTGITPFMSLFSHPSFEEYVNPRIYIGFRSLKYNIYSSELNSISKFSKGVSLKFYYEDENGILDVFGILNENGYNVDFFISGPITMIKDLKRILMDKGVTISQIHIDHWE